MYLIEGTIGRLNLVRSSLSPQCLRRSETSSIVFPVYASENRPSASPEMPSSQVIGRTGELPSDPAVGLSTIGRHALEEPCHSMPYHYQDAQHMPSHDTL